MDTDDILILDDLTKKYGSETAVDNVSLRIRRGTFFGLLGQNGAGKSSIIHCIMGIAKITSGKITVDGTDVEREYKKARLKVGLSPQEFNVDVFTSPRKLLDYVGGYYGIEKKERNRRTELLLRQFDLEKHANMQFMKLSGGLKRRVILARALMHAPQLLILDEPTAGVDVEQRRELWNYLKSLNASGTTIILTSHYLDEIEALCNDIAVIHRGKIVACESKESFTKQGSVEEVYLRITNSLSTNA